MNEWMNEWMLICEKYTKMSRTEYAYQLKFSYGTRSRVEAIARYNTPTNNIVGHDIVSH